LEIPACDTVDATFSVLLDNIQKAFSFL